MCPKMLDEGFCVAQARRDPDSQGASGTPLRCFIGATHPALLEETRSCVIAMNSPALAEGAQELSSADHQTDISICKREI